MSQKVSYLLVPKQGKPGKTRLGPVSVMQMAVIICNFWMPRQKHACASTADDGILIDAVQEFMLCCMVAAGCSGIPYSK